MKNIKPMLNIYPDSLDQNLAGTVDFLKNKSLEHAFGSCYILPSLYHSDLDRGFCVIDYQINEDLASLSDLDELRKNDIDLKLDFVLNHASMNSPMFQDLLEKGEQSKYRDFFIDWNEFWKGCGSYNEQGVLIPDPKWTQDMFFRKPGLPYMMVPFPDGSLHPYWNTFYQKKEIIDGKPHFSGQMDLNLKNEAVWDFYKQTLDQLASYGASIVRLDAFAYAAKEPGKKNFFNEPDTWDILERLNEMAKERSLILLPEIHASYKEQTYKQICEKGYMSYDFFAPGLILDAIENKDPSYLKKWIDEIIENDYHLVNMLGCHDGIGLLDLKGLLPDERISSLIETVKCRGGRIKDLHGAENVYYQINAAYFSALGEDEKKMELARIVQLFLPGKPQVWYLDLLEGSNDFEAVKKAGADGHKEINRTNLGKEQIEKALSKPSVKKQLEWLNLRNIHPAFNEKADVSTKQDGFVLTIEWKHETAFARLQADFKRGTFSVTCSRTG